MRRIEGVLVDSAGTAAKATCGYVHEGSHTLVLVPGSEPPQWRCQGCRCIYPLSAVVALQNG